MPPPPPPDKPCSFGIADLSADEVAEIDPDYLYFLRHLRPDGRGYAVEIPSKDGYGSSRPRVVRYEKPLAASNAEAPAASSEGGTLCDSFPMEVDSSAAVEAPSGAASPPAFLAGEARGDAAPEERDGSRSPKAKPAWYDSVPNINEDYRLFLQHSRVVNDSQMVFEMGNFSITLGEAPSVGNCEDDDEEEDEEDEQDGVEEVEAVFTSGNNSVKTEESEEENYDVEEEKPVVTDLEIETRVKEEVEDTVMSEEGDEKGNDKNEGIGTSVSDLQLVNVMEFEVDEVEEQPLNVSVMRTPEPGPLNTDLSSKQGHSAMPHNASEFEGFIWPAHIIDRPESDFKQKLMKVLIKPFNREEYDKLFANATNRAPVIKERRTRRRSMYYPCKHEMGKSYFDNYPDLAEQVEGENSYPKRLALLRGFFFWMENVGHDEQFRPWTSDFKMYRVQYMTEV